MSTDLITRCSLSQTIKDGRRQVKTVNTFWSNEGDVLNIQCYFLFSLFFTLGSIVNNQINPPTNCQKFSDRLVWKSTEIIVLIQYLQSRRQGWLHQTGFTSSEGRKDPDIFTSCRFSDYTLRLKHFLLTGGWKSSSTVSYRQERLLWVQSLHSKITDYVSFSLFLPLYSWH